MTCVYSRVFINVSKPLITDGKFSDGRRDFGYRHCWHSGNRLRLRLMPAYRHNVFERECSTAAAVEVAKTSPVPRGMLLRGQTL